MSYHLQTNGQVGVSNTQLKKIMKKTINASRKGYAKKLDNALWAYYTIFKTNLGLFLLTN